MKTINQNGKNEIVTEETGYHAIGDHVIFVDYKGIEHNAIVIHVWPSCLNLVWVVQEPREFLMPDTMGNFRQCSTSVPPYAEGMGGYYYKEAK